MNTQPTPAAQQDESLAAKVGRLAATVTAEHFAAGDCAALKRWSLGQPPPLAFYRLWLRHLATDLPPESQTHAWMTLAWGLAYMGRNAHKPGRPFGRTLAEAGYAEARLERLLAADEDVRLELIASAVRFLGASKQSFDWLDAARLLLSSESDQVERIHRRIASDYYRHITAND